MIRASKLFESELIAIARLDHPHDLPHEDPDLEVSPDYSINLIERGARARDGSTRSARRPCRCRNT